MAANWNLPATTSTYTNLIAELDERLDDLAKGLDIAATNLPSGSIRWNSTNNYWEKYNGSSWAALTTVYNIGVSTAATWTTSRNLTISGDATSTHTGVNGSANVNAVLTLATVNSNTGSFGSTSAVPVITVNAKGLITGVTTAALASMATQSSSSVSITGGSISGTTITLPSGTGSTTEGVVQWNTTSDLLLVGTGTVTKTMVDLDSVQTLSNKSATTPADTDYSNLIATAAFVKSQFACKIESTIADWNTFTSPGINDTLTLGTSTNGPGEGSYYYPLTFNYATLDGSGNLSQMAIGYTGNNIYLRNRYSGTWSGWARFLNTNNYTQYVPTLTGSGASGTWGISITGSAGSLGGFTPSQTAGTANRIVVANASGYILNNYFNMTADQTAGTATRIVVETSSDNYLRWQTPAQFFSNHGLLTDVGRGTVHVNGLAINTVYTNSTGRPIFVYCCVHPNATFGSGSIFYLNGTAIATISGNTNLDGQFATIVPPGWTYQVTTVTTLRYYGYVY